MTGSCEFVSHEPFYLFVYAHFSQGRPVNFIMSIGAGIHTSQSSPQSMNFVTQRDIDG